MTTLAKLHYIYIIESQDGRYYTGYTTNIELRFKKHQSGKGAKFTRAFGAKEVVYSESFTTKGEALKRECIIKKLTRKEKEALITNGI